MNNKEGDLENIETENEQEPKKGFLQRCLERTGLTPKALIALAVFSCAYIFLYIVIGSGCLGSIIFVISFLITFIFCFFLIWTTCKPLIQKENSEGKPVNKSNQEAAQNDGTARYQSTEALIEQNPLTHKQEE